MRIFATRWFSRFMRAEGLDDAGLAEAIERAGRGLIDADLGGGLIKLRVARPGGGRSGGYRVIVAYRMGDRAILLFGFAKNRRANIAPHELEDLRLLARIWLDAGPAAMRDALEDGAIREIGHDRTT